MGSEEDKISVKVNEPTVSASVENALNQIASMIKGESNEVNELGKVVKKLHNVPCIYRQDIVVHKKSRAIGVVNEVAGDSDSDGSSSDEDEDEDEDVLDDNDKEGDNGGDNTNVNGNINLNKDSDYKFENLQADHVRVLWMDDTEQVQHVNNVTVVDRGFLHGDYVASVSDPTGQVGIVADVNISVDLLAPDGSVIKDISTRDLKRVREFAVGDYVVLGPWLGRVDDVLDNVTVLIDDGSVCKVVGAEPQRLKPISKTLFDEDEHFPYYPGQRVRASSSSVFRNSRWLSGLWKANRLEGTVTKVTAGSVFIYWIASAGYGPDSSTAPSEEQSPKNLKLLSCFTHANWQVGDWCLLSPSILQSSFTTLDKGLSKLGLHDSVKSELNSSQQGDGCDSEEVTVDDLDGNVESMDIHPAVAQDGKIGISASVEYSSCGSSTSVSKESVHESWPLHRKKMRKVVIRRDKKARKREGNFEKALLIVNTRTRVDVAWQDGMIERGLDATKLIPIESPGDHEFVAEQYIVEKASDDDENASEARRVGVVKSVDAKEKTASVRWLKPVSRAEDPREFDKEEIVSVYELEGHPDYDYSYGDVVVRLSPVTVSAQTSHLEFVGEPKQHTESNETLNSKRRSGHKLGEDASTNEASMELSDLSWVGNITGLRNGDIEVTWADGMVSTVGPQAIFVVGRDDDDDSIAAGSEVSDAATWETVNDDEMDTLENSQEEADVADLNYKAEVGSEENVGRNPALAFPLAALDFVTRLANGIFSRRQNNADSDIVEPIIESDLQSDGNIYISEDSCDESGSRKSNVLDGCHARSTDENGQEHAAMEAPVSSTVAKALFDFSTDEPVAPTCFKDETCNFKRFDITKDPLDHYFLGSNGQISNGRKWLKKVQQDWNILQNNLPDGIYVRVYEDRMDLIRAVIVGAYGTPYQDGLFFFDFHLPPEYPNTPPSAYYHSGGWRINPNLYEEGKVCLSLLNTWTGRGNEVWDPTSSSILQVLVSLQGLVLNSKPYFNEAGYDKQIGSAEGEKNSLSYNENTFLLNCKMMMYLMRKPPKDFDELVREHFKRRGYYILKACDAYMKGSLIGSLTRDASVSNDDNSNLTSVGFKLMLAKIVPKLYLALNEVGAYCHEFKHLSES